MSSTDTGKNEGATSQAFNRVAENLYKHEQSGNYYALIKRSGKQIRRSLKTKDVALAKRRLAGFKAKVFRLDQNGAGKKLTFDDLSEQWLTTQKSDLKEKSAARIETCIKGLRPFFRGQLIRSITRLDCEQWKIKRGDALSPSSYKHERRVLIALFDYSISHGLVLENPAKDLRTRTGQDHYPNEGTV
jgi:hypothetical protein